MRLPLLKNFRKDEITCDEWKKEAIDMHICAWFFWKIFETQACSGFPELYTVNSRLLQIPKFGLRKRI
jgi:hypothetical protein